MSNPAVLIAVRAKLSAVADLPTIAWPNENYPAQTPFLVFDTGATVGTPITIDGVERFEFRPQISYMAEPGRFTAEIDAALWAIAQEFKYGSKITDGGVNVAYCLQTPVADNGRRDGAYFRRDMTLRIASDQKI